MKVITIGYGRQLFTEDNIERERLEICAQAVDSIQAIIFTHKSDGQVKTIVSDKFILYPTSSSSKIGMLFDAYKIGKRLVKESKETVVVSTQDPFETGLIGLFLARHKNVVFQVQEHADVYTNYSWRNETFLNFFRYYFGIFVLKQADIIRVVSSRIKNTLSVKFGLESKIRQVPVATRITGFNNESGDELNERSSQENFVFLTAARFVPQKNFPLMLRAFKKVWDKNKNARLHIYGQGPEEKLIKNTVAEMFSDQPNDNPVRIFDWSKDLGSQMKKADAYLLTSNYEGWARVLIEAICNGLPIVSTEVGCTGEVVVDGVHGLVVPVGDEEALLEAMDSISNDKQFYQNIKQNLEKLKVEDIPGTDFYNYGDHWADTLA